ncbi:MAG: type II toxin-antitoxin system RelE/ParE family toxin [Clostridiales Family XIII bacterium]|jgi:mRNA interferase RelE/StbE|nr:type II toxin-antitoxin system RelE/ParE family toxin [Clostridiales Family XIII bacterium]
MNTVLSPEAAKYLKRLHEPDKSRIISALKKLESEPPQGDIKGLAGKDGYRLRIGKYRALFDIIDDTVIIHTIAPRGQAYKGGF